MLASAIGADYQLGRTMGVLLVNNSVTVEPTKEPFANQGVPDRPGLSLQQHRVSLPENASLIYDQYGAAKIDSHSYVMQGHPTKAPGRGHSAGNAAKLMEGHTVGARNRPGPHSNTGIIQRPVQESRRVSASSVGNALAENVSVKDGDSSSYQLKQLEVNLQADFREMRKLVQSADPVGVQGTRMKTYEGRPRDQVLASRGVKKGQSPD